MRMFALSTMRSFRIRNGTKDYVYFQKTPISVGQSIVQSQIWPRAAGSDHRAVSGDIVLR